MKPSSHQKSSSSIVSASSEEGTDRKTRKGDAKMNASSNANSGLRKRASLRRTEARSKPSPARAFVEHHYHDHARDPIAKSVEIVGARPDSVMSRSFPEKLHLLLDTMDEEGLEHIVSWQPHGRCFVLHEKTEFVQTIMPRFFMQTKLTSFQRQLNLYGFIRLTAGQDRGGYYHEYFLRGRADLCRYMVRTRVKGIGMKAASSPSTEPNFYSYKACPLDESLKMECDGDADSVSSHKTDTGVNLTETTSFAVDSISVPNIVSPPESPVLSSCSIVQIQDILPPCLLDIAREEEESDEEDNYAAKIDSSMPHTGDEVFFEGHVFHYLDHLDLDDVHEMNVTNVEYL